MYQIVANPNAISGGNRIGIDHANAGHHPEWPAHRWEAARLVRDTVDNTSRFLEAAEKIYEKL